MKQELKKRPLDQSEFELPETMFVREIDDRVFQSIILKCLSEIQGIGFLGRTFIDQLLRRDRAEGVRGVVIKQDSKSQSVSIRIEVTIAFGESIPEKTREIQDKISVQIKKMTELHVSCVHVVVKNLSPDGLGVKEVPQIEI